MNEYQQLIIDALIDKKCEALINCISVKSNAANEVQAA
jgi:hypothetical protein